LRQSLLGWDPGFIQQFPNMARLLFARGHGWRLRYEMAYNVYSVISDWLKVISLVVLAVTPGIRWWLLVVYLLYLAFELYSWWVVRIPGSGRRAPLVVLLLFPVYGALNTLLRTASLLVWAWLRFIEGSMRPKRDERDRVPA